MKGLKAVIAGSILMSGMLQGCSTAEKKVERDPFPDEKPEQYYAAAQVAEIVMASTADQQLGRIR